MFAHLGFLPPNNIFRQDAVLQGLIKRFLHKDSYLLMAPALESLGEEIPRLVSQWARQAENEPPRLRTHDAFGNRIDELSLPYGWHKLRDFSFKQRLVSIAHDKKLRQEGRIIQTAMQLMFSSYSSTYSCPLAMSDGAISLLQEHAPLSVKESVIPRLLGKDEKNLATCGQWMTEKIGGSDIKEIETHAVLARKENDLEHYRLYGQKWFVSSIDCEYALVLAQVPEHGPSLFLVEVWNEKKLSLGLKIDKLKNKLGTKALATAEVSLEGVMGTLIAKKGKGISAISSMLNVTRFYNALASASIMNRVFFSAFAYSKNRKSFGKVIYDHVLHRSMMADLDAKRAGATALCFELARLMGLGQESSLISPSLRALIPIAKLSLGKWAVMTASDAIEAIGGVAYIEESELPQMLRDAQVLPIWEGTTNIMALDLVRAQVKNNSLVCLLKELCERANAVMIDETDALRILRTRLSQVSQKVMAAIHKNNEQPQIYLEPIARKMAFSIAMCAMALYLAEAKPFITEQDPFAHNRFTTFVENNLCGHFSL